MLTLALRPSSVMTLGNAFGAIPASGVALTMANGLIRKLGRVTRVSLSAAHVSRTIPFTVDLPIWNSNANEVWELPVAK